MACSEDYIDFVCSSIDGLMADAECGFPYEGSKEKYILDIDHGEEARRIVRLLEAATPFRG